MPPLNLAKPKVAACNKGSVARDSRNNTTMSLGKGGQTIYCDGGNCNAAAPAPVALRRMLTGNDSGSAVGWLFVVRQNVNYHFCPACAERQLVSVRNSGPTGKNDSSCRS